ncbi:MAG: hypothetical protein GY863_01675 [bacterium]|nr:hypothetical protein [bacterium]
MTKFNHIKTQLSLILLLFFLGTSVNCSLETIAVRSMGGVIENTVSAFYSESDYELAKEAISPFILQLEGLIRIDSGNPNLIINACKGYFGYALGFVEDENPERASVFYLRARDYGLELLSSNQAIINSIQEGDLESFESEIDKMRAKDLPVLFWTANSWASYINLNRTDMEALADQSYVDVLMQKVIEIDENYFFASSHMYFGIVLGERGIAGGDLEKSREHFEKCFEITANKFLLAYVMYAQYYAINAFDEDVFVSALKKVLDTPADVLPGYQLLNVIAKKKAEKLLKNKDEYFF